MNEQQADRDPITTCCCMDQGSSEMKTTFDKTVYVPTETAQAVAKIDNKDCKLAVSRVAFKLQMSLDIKTHHGGGFGGHSFHHTYTYAETSCVGPAAGQEDWENLFRLDLSQIKYDKLEQKKKKGEIITMRPQDQFMMSQLQPATRNAKYLKIRYHTVMTTTYDGCTCCSETPDAKTPVTVLPLVNPACFGFAPPADYQPMNLGMIPMQV